MFGRPTEFRIFVHFYFLRNVSRMVEAKKYCVCLLHARHERNVFRGVSRILEQRRVRKLDVAVETVARVTHCVRVD